MTTNETARRSTLGIVVATALILSVPLVAMQFTDEVRWGVADFAIAGTLLLGTGFLYRFAARRAGSLAYRAAVGLALGSALFLVWANLAVGLIGDESNPANLMYLGVLAVGVIGAALARLRAAGMARALFAMAAAHALVGVVALLLSLGGPSSGPLEIVGVTGLFVALFGASGWLFRYAARGLQEV